MHNNMFWYLVILRRHSPWEPAEIACDCEQGDLFRGPHGKLKKQGENLERERRRKEKKEKKREDCIDQKGRIRTRKKFQVPGEACVTMF